MFDSFANPLDYGIAEKVVFSISNALHYQSAEKVILVLDEKGVPYIYYKWQKVIMSGM